MGLRFGIFLTVYNILWLLNLPTRTLIHEQATCRIRSVPKKFDQDNICHVFRSFHLELEHEQHRIIMPRYKYYPYY